MRRISVIFLLVSVAATAFSQQQQVLLLSEDFESTTPSNTFAFDTNGITNHFGSNKWIINNQYDGGSLYPTTTNQDTTEFGTIRNSPYSTYLHIHDANAVGSGVANANYDATAASDRFAYTSDGFCTLGLSNITLAFFYISEGAPGAYGETYYSIDGGTWLPTGAGQYRNQTKWKYVTIANPAFDNVGNVRFGFRWVNGTGSPPSTRSFGLDDILIVGTYDTITSPKLTVPFVSPIVCRLSPVILQWHLSDPLCDGSYRVELSRANGSFSNPINLGFFLITDLDTIGAVSALIPGTTLPDNCYRVRIVRISPPPAIIGDSSDCFIIRACPNTITTLTPVVTTDPDTVCSRSAIDVPFYSTGLFNGTNVYIAQLSDSAGNFDTTFNLIPVIDTTVFPPDTTFVLDTVVTPVYSTIGTFPSKETYDPANGSMPGNVSGLVPVVPEGCNYYIRVVSTSPVAIGSLYGPFCIKHCDITTNETMDISVCIHDTVGVIDTVEIDINQWNTSASYLAGNRFIVQLLDMMTLSVVNTGGLGVLFDTVSSVMILDIPGLQDLLARGIMPGSYYMRIIADNSTNPWNSNGTIIRLMIGAPADNPSIPVPDKTVYCNAEIAYLTITPYNANSDYEWTSGQLNNGVSFIWPGNTLAVDLSGASPGEYGFRVREKNFGCWGAYSPVTKIYVVTPPDVNITGPTQVCEGDTFFYQVPFLAATYYEWSLSWGTMVDTSNNEINIRFDSTGIARLGIYALNACGTATNTYNVRVEQTIHVDAGQDTTICPGNPVRLEGTGAILEHVLESSFSGPRPYEGSMFNVKANYDLTITGFDAKFSAVAPANVRIYYRPAPYAGSETDSTSWLRINSSVGIIPDSAGSVTPIPIPINIFIPAGQTFAFYITTTNRTKMMHTEAATAGLYATDGVLDFYSGAGLTYAFNSPVALRVWNGRIHYVSEAGISYLWSNGDSTAATTVRPVVTSDFVILASDTAGCIGNDRVSVFVNPLPPVDAGQYDTVLCEGLPVQLNATGADMYTWSPGDGLSDANISNPVATLTESAMYLLKGTDTATGCINYDTLQLTVEGCDVILQIPQAFTPNGDGHNDFFTVFGDNIDKYEIRIFNRWGEQVYYSTNVAELSAGSDFNKGWNGEHKGKPQDTGVYVYYIKATSGDAAPLERKGNVTLIR